MSEIRTTFFDLYARGDATEDEIDDHVDRWHVEMAGRESAGVVPLAAYLGLTDGEYAAWVEDGTALPRILKARLSGAPLDAAFARED
jgi:hypothetical protein